MKLPCDHGRYEEHKVNYPLNVAVAANHFFGTLCPGGRLVEIDYEAAWAYARQEDAGDIGARSITKGERDNLVVLDKVDVMAAVDIALGKDPE